jgi:hypothetical protein
MHTRSRHAPCALAAVRHAPQPLELGAADDRLFGRTRSGQVKWRLVVAASLFPPMHPCPVLASMLVGHGAACLAPAHPRQGSGTIGHLSRGLLDRCGWAGLAGTQLAPQPPLAGHDASPSDA